MRKSKTETAETRTKILATASRLFLENGWEAVGMREVMAASDLTAGGFYRHFQSKDQLVVEAMQAAFDRLIAMLETEIAGKSPSNAIDRIVFLYLHQTQSSERLFLCPLAMAGTGFRHSSAQIQAVAGEGQQRLLELIASQLTRKPRQEALAIASGILSTLVGAVTLAGLASAPSAAEAILDNAAASIKRLVSGLNLL